MQKHVRVSASFVVLLLVSVAAAARNEMHEEIAALRQQIERLNTRLEKMESQKSRHGEQAELARMMKEILDDAQAAPALPEWMKNLKFGGDFRLRAETLTYQGRRGGGDTLANPGVGEQKTRNRIRMRLRFGFTKTWWDNQMEVGFRLASGSDAAPNSANQTMTGDFSKKPVWIDLMYAKYKPNWAQGLEIVGGKVANPIRTATLLTWDSQVNPEGIHLNYTAPFFGDFKPYGQVGFWLVNENGVRHATWDTTVRDTEMLNAGTGFDWKIAGAVDWFLGATYYKYYNADASNGGWLGRYGVDGQWASVPGGGRTPAQVSGGLGYPSADFGILELTTKVGWKFDFLPAPLQKWQAWFTYVRNCKDDYSVSQNPPSAALVGADRHFQHEPNAYGAGITIGENKKKNDFSIGYTYYYMEYASTVPGFVDGTIGGPNTQGHLLQAVYNIDDFLTIAGVMCLYEPIHTSDNPANATNRVVFSHSQDMTGTFRVELVWKF